MELKKLLIVCTGLLVLLSSIQSKKRDDLTGVYEYVSCSSASVKEDSIRFLLEFNNNRVEALILNKHNKAFGSTRNMNYRFIREHAIVMESFDPRGMSFSEDIKTTGLYNIFLDFFDFDTCQYKINNDQLEIFKTGQKSSFTFKKLSCTKISRHRIFGSPRYCGE